MKRRQLMIKIALMIFLIMTVVLSASKETNNSKPQKLNQQHLLPVLTALSVADLDKSVTWYVAHLGFREHRRLAFPDHGLRVASLVRDDFWLELIEKKGAKRIAELQPGITDETLIMGYKKLAFRCRDIDTLFQTLTAKGVTVLFEPSDNEFLDGVIRNFIVTDPDGNWLQFLGPTSKPPLSP